jgi:hypothetical protein
VAAAIDEPARIREALLDLCFERGYANLELPMLLARAGEAFHRLYADLEDCFCAVYMQARNEFFARVQRAASRTSRAGATASAQPPTPCWAFCGRTSGSPTSA